MQRSLYDAEHESFRSSFRSFLDRDIVPHHELWSEEGIVPREVFERAGAGGFVGFDLPEEHGGGGNDDYRFNAVIAEEIGATGVAGSGLGIGTHNDICIPYFRKLADEAQRERWFPGLASGRSISAVAMTEPGAGSDLGAIRTTARRDGDHYIVDGVKTFISNGINADLVVVVARTSAHHSRGLTLLVVERGMPGFERGRNLDKLGLHSQDTAELFFDGVRVPVANRLGDEGGGFAALMDNLAQERLGIAVTSVAVARAALAHTVAHAQKRPVFGAALGELQNTRFVLAECATEIDVAQSFVDDCVRAHVRGALTSEDAAKAKWWSSEAQGRVVDRCLQLHGGYGYMLEYPIARSWLDSRVSRIYGGTTEIMKEVVGREVLRSR
jgi:alkylation response protein AidB-like acyl-CoA dehydrogenase